jgi:hypothetical protein
MSTESPHRSTRPATSASAQSLRVTASFFGTLLVAKHLSRSLGKGHQDFCLGTDPSADIALLDSPSFALVEAVADGFVLRFDPDWDGCIALEGRMWTLRELATSGMAHKSAVAQAMELRIPTDCTIQIQVGTVEYWIRPTGVARKLGRRSWHRGLPPYRYALASAFFFLSALLALPQVSEQAKIFDERALIATTRLAEDRSKALEEEQRKHTPAQPGAREENHSKPSTRESRLLVAPSAFEVVEETPPPTREAATRRARKSGIMGLAGVDYGSLVPNLKYDSSDEAIERYGKLRAQDVNKATGAWGHGIRKIGPGSGDGKDWGTVKSRYKMASAKQGGSEYVANALKRPPDFDSISVSSAAEDLVGSGLRYDVIRGQLGLRMRRLRRCFELDETSDVGAPGQLVLGFHISAQGEVGDAEVEDVEHPKVRSCVEGTLLSIRFPEPSDGKSISVKGFSMRI